MRILQLLPHLKTEEIAKKLSTENNPRLFVYWQILLSVSNNPNKKAEEYALFLGIKASKVYKIVQLYNKGGANFTDNLQWGGRRDARSYLTLEQERKMMEEFSEKALSGKILTAKSIKKEVEQKVGKDVSDDYIWDLFKRMGWSKKVPRPKHSKQDIEQQQEFKKNFPKNWQPTS